MYVILAVTTINILHKIDNSFCPRYVLINSLPNDKFSDLSKLKDFDGWVQYYSKCLYNLYKHLE